MRGFTLAGQWDAAESSGTKVSHFLANRGVRLLFTSIMAFSLACESPRAAQQPATPKAETKMHRTQAGKADRDGWYRAESTEGHFRVKLPIPFNDYTVRSVDKNGRKMSVYAIGATSAEKYTFAVSEFPEMPDQRPPDVLLQELVDKFRKEENVVSEEKRFKYKGHAEVQFNVASPQSTASMRYVVADGRIWFQIAECPPSSRNDVEPLLIRFFDSLELTDARPPDPKKP